MAEKMLVTQALDERDLLVKKMAVLQALFDSCVINDMMKMFGH